MIFQALQAVAHCTTISRESGISWQLAGLARIGHLEPEGSARGPASALLVAVGIYLLLTASLPRLREG